MRPDHYPELRGENPNGECVKCGKHWRSHRIDHEAAGDPCVRCGLPASMHRARKQTDKRGRRKYRPRASGPSGKGGKEPLIYWGVDGEGQGRDPHRYTLLAAVDETGTKKEFIEGNITTERALDFFCDLPTENLFAYSFGYDLTKILAGLPTKKIFQLCHENLPERQRKGPDGGPSPMANIHGPKPVVWRPRKGKVFLINLRMTKTSITRIENGRVSKMVIWDIWKFFQGKFTTALENWEIGSPAELVEMARMKNQRADFDKLDRHEVRAYCLDECHKMAQLARKLRDAHVDAGLNLKNFFGAGSTASAMLKQMGIKEKRGETPREMAPAIASAFFGGRFENSVIGSIPGPVYSFDISSAYPYECYSLPCLEHARWSHVKRRKGLRGARQAIVRYRLGKALDPHATWAPFPFRMSDGSICFPIESGGGWVYLDEFLAGEALFPHVEFVEAYVLHTSCVCRPFEKIPEYYRERSRLGNDARGIVLKLGMNSIYGKTAQSIGDSPPFQSWVWAGMITSGTRAQILRALGNLSSHDQLLMVATDGIYTREDLRGVFDAPRDTGTSDLKKPLGGWTSDVLPRGVFAARPGIYFPLQPTGEELKKVRARGVGKLVMHSAWKDMQAAHERGDKTVQIRMTCERCEGEGCRSCHTSGPNKGKASPVRFMGMKSSTRKVGDEYRRADYYGEWLPRDIKISFNPLPKRERVLEDGISLELRRLPRDLESLPYSRAVAAQAPEAVALRLGEQEADEQPDGGDFAMYG
jgi:hypothetical protein